jgi:hypothetical protein
VVAADEIGVGVFSNAEQVKLMVASFNRALESVKLSFQFIKSHNKLLDPLDRKYLVRVLIGPHLS